MADAVRSVFAAAAILGEGPVWIGKALWFVDIKSKLIYRFDPASGDAKRWSAPEQIGWILPTRSAQMVVGLKSSLHYFDPSEGIFTRLQAPAPAYPGNRLNDATTDVTGRLWFGTMDDAETAETGLLYRAADGLVEDSGLPPVTITNGPAIDAAANWLYHTDTLGKRIWRVPLQADGSLGTPVLHITIEPEAGYPDGPVIDAEGCLWTGLFGGWGVRRYDPDGTLMRSVRFPVANVTKIAFGGADLRTAYATTARKGLDAIAMAAQPEAGNLFTFDPGVAGLPVAPARL